MASTPFSIPFRSPFTLDQDIDFGALYPGEGFHYVKSRVIGYDAHHLIVGVQSRGQKERKVTFNISPDILKISCSCKTQEGKLCAHGSHALHDLCWKI